MTSDPDSAAASPLWVLFARFLHPSLSMACIFESQVLGIQYYLISFLHVPRKTEPQLLIRFPAAAG